MTDPTTDDIDPDDTRTGSHIEGDETGCAEPVPDELIDPDGDLLARGDGEADGPGGSD